MTLAEIFREEGFKEGFEKGFEKGRIEYKKEAAEKLFTKGFSLEEVVELVGLSLEEIEGIANVNIKVYHPPTINPVQYWNDN